MIQPWYSCEGIQGSPDGSAIGMASVHVRHAEVSKFSTVILGDLGASIGEEERSCLEAWGFAKRLLDLLGLHWSLDNFIISLSIGVSLVRAWVKIGYSNA